MKLLDYVLLAVAVTVLALVILTAGVVISQPFRIAPPATLLVNEAKWTVRMVDAFPSDDDLMGWTDIHRHEILLRRGMCVEEERDTLWHELHHAMMGESFSVEKWEGHQVIYMMTPAEMHTLRDNPELVRYLTK